MTNKEINTMKKAVKEATGLNMKDIEITNCGTNMIGYKYFATNYDRVTNNYTHRTLEV